MQGSDVPSRIASASMLDVDSTKVLFTASNACMGNILEMTDDEVREALFKRIPS